MYRKKSYKHLSSLWAKHNPTKPRLTVGTVESYYKKSMDDICLQAELSESSNEYASIICSGMQRLIRMGVQYKHIEEHKNLMLKIIYLGRDIMTTSKSKDDLFYIGVLLDLKIIEKLTSLDFFVFIVNALKGLKKKMNFISNRIKLKLIEDLKISNLSLYLQYFENKLSVG